MRQSILCFLISTVFLIGGLGSATAGDADVQPSVINWAPEAFAAQPEEPSLHARFVQAILKSRSIKQTKGERRPYWFECGKKVKKADRQERASEWATWILKAIGLANEKHSAALPEWGVLATVHKESGFDVCALDITTREWAATQGLAKFKLSYTRDEVFKIVTSKERVRSKWKMDLGPMQKRYKGKITRAYLDEILSLDPGMVWGAEEMARRSTNHKIVRDGKRIPYPRPWRLWPGTNPRAPRSHDYDKRITRIARWLGATETEI